MEGDDQAEFAVAHPSEPIPSSNQQKKDKKRGRLFQLVATQAAQDKKETPPFILPPGSPVRRFWDFASFVFLVAYLVLLPFAACFAPGIFASDQLSLEWLIGLWALDAFFLVDIYLRIRHFSYFDSDGEDVTEWRTLATTYCSSSDFALDLLAALPIEALMLTAWRPSIDLRYLYWYRLNRALRLRRLPTLWTELRQFVETHLELNAGYVRMAGLGFAFLYLAHLLACLFFFVGATRAAQGLTSWLEAAGLLHQPLWFRYLRSLYWAVVTAATIGYGDLRPTSLPEAAVGVAALFLGALSYQCVVASLTVIAEALGAPAAEQALQLEALRQLARHRRLAPELEQRAQNVLYHAWSTQLGKGEAAIEARLPPHLLLSMRCAQALDTLRAVPLFQACSQPFLRVCAAQLHSVAAGPGDTLVLRGDHVQQAYFVYLGAVRCSDSAASNANSNAEGEGSLSELTLQPGDAFCTDALLDVRPSPVSFRVFAFSILLTLSRQALELAFKFFPEERARMLANAAAVADTVAGADADEHHGDGKSSSVDNSDDAIQSNVDHVCGYFTLVPPNNGKASPLNVPFAVQPDCDDATAPLLSSSPSTLSTPAGFPTVPPLNFALPTLTSPPPNGDSAVINVSNPTVSTQLSTRRTGRARQSLGSRPTSSRLASVGGRIPLASAANAPEPDQAESSNDSHVVDVEQPKTIKLDPNVAENGLIVAAAESIHQATESATETPISARAVRRNRLSTISKGRRLPRSKHLIAAAYNSTFITQSTILSMSAGDLDLDGDETANLKGVIMLDSNFRLVWDALMLLCSLYHACIVPLRIGFLTVSSSVSDSAFSSVVHPTIWFDCFLDVLCLVDIWLRLRRFAVMADGSMVTDPDGLQSRNSPLLPLDLLAACPLDLFGTRQFLRFILVRMSYVLFSSLPALLYSPGLLYWLRLTRLLQLRRCDARLGSLGILRLNESVLRMVREGVQLSLCAHWLACAWFLVSALDAWPPSWERLPDAQLGAHFLESIYYTLVTMATVGYGTTTDN